MRRFNMYDAVYIFAMTVCAISIIYACSKADASTRPWEDDPDFIEYVSEHVSDDQWNRLVVFDEKETCPVNLDLPDGAKRQILSIGPGGCTPLHSERDFSIWPPGCFFWIVKLGYGLENLLFSKKCEVHISTPNHARGI